MQILPMKATDDIQDEFLCNTVTAQNKYLQHVKRIVLHNIPSLPSSIILDNGENGREEVCMAEWLMQQKVPEMPDQKLFLGLDSGP